MFADAATSPRWRHNETGCDYIGPDHCSSDGARALAERLTRYWRGRGQDREFEVYTLKTSYADARRVYGVREVKRSAPVVAQRAAPVGAAPRERIKKVISDTLALYHPHLKPADIMVRARGNGIPGALRDCICAVKATWPELSLPQIGAIFDRDHTTVLYALSAERRAKVRASREARSQ